MYNALLNFFPKTTMILKAKEKLIKNIKYKVFTAISFLETSMELLLEYTTVSFQ